MSNRISRRSWLFVPANKTRWAEPAVRSGADCIILDLEDAVATNAKEAARENCLTQLAAIDGMPVDGGSPRVFVRINGLHTRWWLDDLIAVSCGPVRPTGIVVPELRDAREISTLDTVLTALTGPWGAPDGVELHPIFETPQAILHAESVLSASPRIQSYFGGAAPDADLASLMGFRWSANRSETLFVRSFMLLAGRSVGIHQPVGGTWLDIHDLTGLKEYAQETHSLGFDGMYLIHPSHVAVANAVFGPSEKEVIWARNVMSVLDQVANDGAAAAVLDGRMIDEATRARARNILGVVS